MKLYLIIPSLGTGGAERVGVLLANGFARRGNEVTVFTNLAYSKDYQLHDTILLIDISKQNGGRAEKWCHAIHVVRKTVKDNPPDFFIGIMGVFSLVAYIACIGLHVPVIATMHNSFERPSYAPMSKFEWMLKFFFNKLFRKVTLLTSSDSLVVEDKLKNTIVMPNPLALCPLKEIVNRDNIIMAIGRLDDWHYKGLDVLIRAWGKIVESLKLRAESEEWKLQIAGSGSEKSLVFLKQLCKENGVEDSVEFLGFRKDVEKLYQDASIFVLSSRYEGFGLVLIEAMSQGCACVACDYKGRQREILNPAQDQALETRNLNLDARPPRTLIPDVPSPTRSLSEHSGERTRNCKFEACDTGILCEPDDVEALAESMKKMILDDEYRESVRQNAIERSKYYSLENTITRWESLLSHLES